MLARSAPTYQSVGTTELDVATTISRPTTRACASAESLACRASATILTRLPLPDFDAVFDLVAGMKHDLVAFGQAFENFGLQAVLAADFHHLLVDDVVHDRNTADSLPTRNSALVGTLSTSSASSMTIRASTRKPSPSVGRSSGGSTRSTITYTRCSSTPSVEIFVKPDGSTTRTRPCSGAVAAPMFQQHRVARVNLHRVAREHVDLDFQVERVAQLHQRRARRHHGRAFLQHAQHAAVDRRIDRKVPAAVAVGFAIASAIRRRIVGRRQIVGVLALRRSSASGRGRASAPPRPAPARSGRSLPRILRRPQLLAPLPIEQIRRFPVPIAKRALP